MEMKSGSFVPATAGLSVPCVVLALSHAGSFSSVHGGGYCKKTDSNIESESCLFGRQLHIYQLMCCVIQLMSLQRLKECVRANGGHFE